MAQQKHSFKSPTATQIAEYHALKREINRLIRRINAPYSAALISFLQIPDYLAISVISTISPINKLIRYCIEPRYIAELHYAFDFALNKSNELNVGNFDIEPIISFWQQQLNWESMMNSEIIYLITHPIKQFSGNTERSDALNLTDLTIRNALLLTSIQDYVQLPLIISTEILSLISKYFIDSLILKYIPGGIYYSRIPKKLLAQKNIPNEYHAIEEAINTLKTTTNHLRHAAKKHSQFSYIILFVFLLHFIFSKLIPYIWQNYQNTSNFNTPIGWGWWLANTLGQTTLALATMTIHYLATELYGWYEIRSLNKVIADKLDTLNHITANLIKVSHWVTYETENHSSCFFSFEAYKDFHIKLENCEVLIKKTQLIQALKEVLIKHKVRIFSQGKTQLTINIEDAPKNNKKDRLQSEFNTYINRLIEINKNYPTLATQYFDIFQLLKLSTSRLIRIMEKDSFNLKLEVNLERWKAEKTNTLYFELTQLFPNHEIILANDMLHLIGYQVANEASFNAAIKLIKNQQATQVLTTEYNPFASTTQAIKNKKTSKKKDKPTAENATSIDSPTSTTDLPFIQWNNGVKFNPKKYDSANIKPGQVIPLHAASLPSGRFFARITAIYPSNAVKQRHVDQFNKGKIVGENAKRGHGKKKQGITASSGTWINPQNQTFWAQYEVKVISNIDAIGNGRTFGHEVAKITVDNIERTLFDFDTFEPYAH